MPSVLQSVSKIAGHVGPRTVLHLNCIPSSSWNPLEADEFNAWQFALFSDERDEEDQDMDVEVEKVHVPSEVFGSLKPAGDDDDEEEGKGQ